MDSRRDKQADQEHKGKSKGGEMQRGRRETVQDNVGLSFSRIGDGVSRQTYASQGRELFFAFPKVKLSVGLRTAFCLAIPGGARLVGLGVRLSLSGSMGKTTTVELSPTVVCGHCEASGGSLGCRVLSWTEEKEEWRTRMVNEFWSLDCGDCSCGRREWTVGIQICVDGEGMEGGWTEGVVVNRVVVNRVLTDLYYDGKAEVGWGQVKDMGLKHIVRDGADWTYHVGTHDVRWIEID